MYKLDREHFSFAHRRNNDGTVDSICPSCFRTVAQSARESDLQAEENSHVCNPVIVEHYRGLSKAISDYAESKGHVPRIIRRSRPL
jgi:hypothetical protein